MINIARISDDLSWSVSPSIPQENILSLVVMDILDKDTMIYCFLRPPIGSGIMIVTETRPLSSKLPECTERGGHWYYNYPAIVALIKANTLIWSPDSLIDYINSISGNSLEKAKIIHWNNAPFPGYIDPTTGELEGNDNTATWWTLTNSIFWRIQCVTMHKDNSDWHPRMGIVDPRYGFFSIHIL